MTSASSASSAAPPPPQEYVLLYPYHRRRPTTFTRILRTYRRYCLYLTAFLLLATALFLLYPSDPELSVVRLHVDHLQFHALPISLDITLDLTIKLRNKDFYSINYDYLTAAISYRGKKLGIVSSDQGRVKARAASYVNATLQLQGVELFDDVVPLIADLAKGFVTFDTVTKIGGELGLGLFDIPLKAKVACEIVIDVHNMTISHQNCYPE